jgi:glycosyltransferase involved in cell wall biosynthesis
VYIADICPSFTAHLRQHFSLTTAAFAPYTSSILSDDDEFTPLPAPAVQDILRKYHIPRHQNLVLAFGRAAPVKGFEYIIPALAPLREHCHLVLISVPYGQNDPQQQLYDRLLAAHRLAATHIKHFTRELPKALCQWPQTRLVLMPSQQETFSNIVLEVALWARHHGPVVAASQVGGFVDQIVPGENGFFIDTAVPDTITRTVRQVLELPEATHARLRRNAYQRVLQQYDFRRNFPTTLRVLWGENAPPPG